MLVEADLPNDPALLRAMLIASDTRVAERDQRIADLESADTDARHEIERLNAIIDALQRHRFGARSEQLDPDQLDLAFEEISAALSRVQAGLDARKPGAPKARNTNRGQLPAHLERIEIVVARHADDLVRLERLCTCRHGHSRQPETRDNRYDATHISLLR